MIHWKSSLYRKARAIGGGFWSWITATSTVPTTDTTTICHESIVLRYPKNPALVLRYPANDSVVLRYPKNPSLTLRC